MKVRFFRTRVQSEFPSRVAWCILFTFRRRTLLSFVVRNRLEQEQITFERRTDDQTTQLVIASSMPNKNQSFKSTSSLQATPLGYPGSTPWMFARSCSDEDGMWAVMAWLQILAKKTEEAGKLVSVEACRGMDGWIGEAEAKVACFLYAQRLLQNKWDKRRSERVAKGMCEYFWVVLSNIPCLWTLKAGLRWSLRRMLPMRTGRSMAGTTTLVTTMKALTRPRQRSENRLCKTRALWLLLGHQEETIQASERLSLVFWTSSGIISTCIDL